MTGKDHQHIKLEANSLNRYNVNNFQGAFGATQLQRYHGWRRAYRRSIHEKHSFIHAFVQCSELRCDYITAKSFPALLFPIKVPLT